MQSLSDIAQSYYIEMGNKNPLGLGQYLHTDVQFIGPLANMVGKDRVLDAANKFMKLFDSLEIQHKFENDNNAAMIVFDLTCPPPIGKFRATTFMVIENNLITQMELFYDARPFEAKKEAIFSNN